MNPENKWSLIQLFGKFAKLGAEWVMWLLVGLSVLSVAVILERLRFYLSQRDDIDTLANDLRQLLRKRDLQGAKARLKLGRSPAAAIALAGIAEADRGADAASEAMAGASVRQRLGLERNLAFLGTIGNNAPFIGLFGTVIGIIQAFDALQANQSAAASASKGGEGAAAAVAQQTMNTGRVMGTIAEALVATAIGLFVAIPAVALFNFFQRKVRSMIAEGEGLSHIVLGHLKGGSSGDERSDAGVTPSPAASSEERSEARSSSRKDEGRRSESKKDEGRKAEAKKDEPKASEAKKDDAAKDESKSKTDSGKQE